VRLWHYKLIPYLPRQQLLGQHRECCALRGNGWGRNHATVNYVFRYSPCRLFQYHMLVRNEMLERGYHFDQSWADCQYRGKRCRPYTRRQCERQAAAQAGEKGEPIYPEHNERYLAECITNLQRKGIILDLSLDD